MPTRTAPGARGSEASGQAASARFSRVPLSVMSSRHGLLPDGGTSASPAEVRPSRGTNTSPARMASCGSPVATAGSRASWESSMSTRTSRPGFSDCAERIMPQAAAPDRSDSSSSPRGVTAPCVAITSRASAKRESASHSWTSASSSCTLRRTSDARSPEASAWWVTRTSPTAGSTAARSSYGSAPRDTGQPSPSTAHRRAGPSDGRGDTGRGDHSRWNSAS